MQRNPNFANPAGTKPHFFPIRPKETAKMAFDAIIYGIKGVRGAKPTNPETMLGINPKRTPASIPRRETERNKTIFTIVPVMSCIFIKGAKIAIDRKNRNKAVFVQTLSRVKIDDFILSYFYS